MRRMGSVVDPRTAMRLVARQIAAKLVLGALCPGWYSGMEGYRLAVKYVATVVARESVWARHLLERLGFWERLEAAGSVEEVIELCSEVWRESDGVLDLCP